MEPSAPPTHFQPHPLGKASDETQNPRESIHLLRIWARRKEKGFFHFLALLDPTTNANLHCTFFLHIFHPSGSHTRPSQPAIIFNSYNSIVSRCLSKADPNSLSRGTVHSHAKRPIPELPLSHSFHTRYCCISWSFRAPHCPRVCSLNTGRCIQKSWGRFWNS